MYYMRVLMEDEAGGNPRKDGLTIIMGANKNSGTNDFKQLKFVLKFTNNNVENFLLNLNSSLKMFIF